MKPSDNQMMAEKIAKKIEDDLNDRGGMGLDQVDPEIRKEIHDTWVKIIYKEILKGAKE
jgi:hypothetical protein